MQCENCGFIFSLKYPLGQKLLHGMQANVVNCPVCNERVTAFDEAARSPVVLHEQL